MSDTQTPTQKRMSKERALEAIDDLFEAACDYVQLRSEFPKADASLHLYWRECWRTVTLFSERLRDKVERKQGSYVDLAVQASKITDAVATDIAEQRTRAQADPAYAQPSAATSMRRELTAQSV